MGKYLKEGHEDYHEENVVEKLKLDKHKERLKDEKYQKLLSKINDFCGITSGKFDRQKCDDFLEELFRHAPELKEKFEQEKEMLKKSLVAGIREKQYNGGLLSDLSYNNLSELNLKKIEQHIQELQITDTSGFSKEQKKDHFKILIEEKNKLFMLPTLEKKGFRIENIRQINNNQNGFSAMYIENQKEEGFFVVRGTKGDVAFYLDIPMWIKDGSFHAQTDSALNAFKELVPSDKKVTVYGHSLGGHLAQIIAFKYYNQIEEVITYDAPGLQNSDILHQLFEMRPNPYTVTNIVTERPNDANKIGTRVGETLKLDKTEYHAISGINNRLADMSVKDMSDWTKKNELAIAKAKKEVMCDDVTNIDIPYCKTQIEKLRKTYPEDKELLKKIDYEERMIEVMKKKNELLLYASAQNTTGHCLHDLREKFPQFEFLSMQKKYDFIIHTLLTTPNTKFIPRLINIYRLEKNGYKMKNMFDSLKSESQIRIVHIPHETLPKRIITFQPLIGKTWNILDVKSQFFHDIHSGEKKILIGEYQGGILAEQLATMRCHEEIEKIVTFNPHRDSELRINTDIPRPPKTNIPISHIETLFMDFSNKKRKTPEDNHYKISTPNDYTMDFLDTNYTEINYARVINQLDLETFDTIFKNEGKK